MSNFQPSSSSNWFIKLIPTITTVCVTLGTVAIYNSQTNDAIKISDSNTSQIPGPQGPAGAQGVAGPAGAQGVAGPAGAQGATGPAGSSGSGGGSGMILKDAKQVAVSNFVTFSDDGAVVYKNNRFFTYTGSYSTGFSGIPRGESIWTPMFLTPDCTGAIVLDGRQSPIQSSYSFATYNGDDFIYLDGLYTAGNISSGEVQLYQLSYGNCQNVGLVSYRETIALPTSEWPAVLASPIRITFN